MGKRKKNQTGKKAESPTVSSSTPQPPAKQPVEGWARVKAGAARIRSPEFRVSLLAFTSRVKERDFLQLFPRDLGPFLQGELGSWYGEYPWIVGAEVFGGCWCHAFPRALKEPGKREELATGWVLAELTSMASCIESLAELFDRVLAIGAPSMRAGAIQDCVRSSLDVLVNFTRCNESWYRAVPILLGWMSEAFGDDPSLLVKQVTLPRFTSWVGPTAEQVRTLAESVAECLGASAGMGVLPLCTRGRRTASALLRRPYGTWDAVWASVEEFDADLLARELSSVVDQNDIAYGQDEVSLEEWEPLLAVLDERCAGLLPGFYGVGPWVLGNGVLGPCFCHGPGGFLAQGKNDQAVKLLVAELERMRAVLQWAHPWISKTPDRKNVGRDIGDGEVLETHWTELALALPGLLRGRAGGHRFLASFYVWSFRQQYAVLEPEWEEQLVKALENESVENAGWRAADLMNSRFWQLYTG